VLSLTKEIDSLRELLGEPATGTLLARERREVFSIHPELRVLAWAGAMLLATAAGIVLKNNLDRVGPVALAILIGVAAAACYVWAWTHRKRASLIDDYVLLLGALLVSADLGFIETQFHWFGEQWARHFLLLALIHGIGAYRFGSRMLLSLSISALAAWLGLQQRQYDFFSVYDVSTAVRSFTCAALVLLWRWLDARFRPERTFARVFEHFAANLLLGGAFVLIENRAVPRIAGPLLTLLFAAGVIAWGFRTRAEAFVLYAFIYAVVAVDVFVVSRIDEEALGLLFIVASMIAAIGALIALHSRFKRTADAA
jgi:hypothetical protein